MSLVDDRPAATTHLGLLHDGPDDLVARVLPALDRALHRGDAVSTVVDRRTARGLREALGHHAGALTFASPHAGPPRAGTFLRRVHDMVTATPGRPAWVLAQYSAFATSDEELRTGEDGVNLVLGDLPLTLVCACARDAGPGPTATVHHTHPAWLEGAGCVDNPGFRPPEDRSPTPSEVWGGVHLAQLHFGATVDLHRVRTHAAALAAEVGLRGERARAAVLAVHEAAVLACDEVADAELPGDDGPCVLDVWAAGTRLVAEVRGPRAPLGPAAQVAAGFDARLPRNRLRMAGPLRLVRTFCDEVTSRETPTARAVRVVAGP